MRRNIICVLFCFIISFSLTGEEKKDSSNILKINVAPVITLLFIRLPILEVSYQHTLNNRFTFDSNFVSYFLSPYLSIGTSFFPFGKAPYGFYINSACMIGFFPLLINDFTFSTPIKVGYQFINDSRKIIDIGIGASIIYTYKKNDEYSTSWMLYVLPAINASIGFSF